MTFLFRFELVVILGIHTSLNMGARPWIYVAQIYNRLNMPRDLDSDVYRLDRDLNLAVNWGKASLYGNTEWFSGV